MLNRTFVMREAIDAMTNSNKDPRNFEITDDEWNKIKEIISVLKVRRLTNKKINKLEAYCKDLDSSKDIVIAVKVELEKLEFYYKKSDETTMYTIATDDFIETVLNVYNTNYVPSIINVGVDDNNNNDKLLNYIFGKKKNHQHNEVEMYLKNSRADQNQDVLLW
ncbi:hypothetical protein RhiirA5_433733 [Rhizophagus irregularis]|uniref:Uncharacterized protein n=1 Tax=Rhizophagus irregularis TaxID=588596 RepID=A0A2N0NRA3_9GLOM|nr:hypothetical protein RhiirA5_433733 [Rhizophagus irregularis]